MEKSYSPVAGWAVYQKKESQTNPVGTKIGFLEVPIGPLVLSSDGEVFFIDQEGALVKVNPSDGHKVKIVSQN